MADENICTAEQMVSMRCVRHKKRFDVPESWLTTCAWLCPKCYDKLTEAERESYKPADGKMPAVRKIIQSKPVPTIEPLQETNEHCETSKCHCESENISEQTKEESVEVEQNKEKRQSKYRHEMDLPVPDIKARIELANLLPRYKVKCMKCGEVAPCHYSWFDKSTVLCPACYSKMGETQIEIFHAMYHADKPEYINDSKSTPSIPVVREQLPGGKTPSWATDSERMKTGGRWTCKHILYASKSELKEGLEKGKISPVRYRIEMKRRRNLNFYDMCPPSFFAKPTFISRPEG